MKQVFYSIAFLTAILIVSVSKVYSQKKDTTEINIDGVKIIVTDNGDTIKKSTEGRHSIEISTRGIRYTDNEKPKKENKKLHVGMQFDFGFNNILDKTNYNNLTTSNVLQDSMLRPLNSNDLDLLNVNSVNVNIWPLWLRQDIVQQHVQLETGLGFQFFNYQFDSRIRHTDKVPLDGIPLFPAASYVSGFEEINDPTQLIGKEKNKLGVSYVSVPLILRFNSKEHKDHQYFVGFGVIGSYKLKSWTKFYGDKESGRYGINDWMLQATAELGVTGIIKLYGTFALQSMYEIPGGQNPGVDRRPFAIGIRL